MSDRKAEPHADRGVTQAALQANHINFGKILDNLRLFVANLAPLQPLAVEACRSL